MALACAVLLSLFWSLVHSHTFPYVSFMGQPLANLSYVDLSTVENNQSNSDSIVCHTDLSTCCSGGQGSHRGDWYFPGGTQLPFAGSSVPIGEARGAQVVVIRRATATTGIYRCGIPTRAVHDDFDNSVRDTVYVGLYTGSGGILYFTFCPTLHRAFQNLIFRKCDNIWRYDTYCAL